MKECEVVHVTERDEDFLRPFSFVFRSGLYWYGQLSSPVAGFRVPSTGGYEERKGFTKIERKGVQKQ